MIKVQNLSEANDVNKSLANDDDSPVTDNNDDEKATILKKNCNGN